MEMMGFTIEEALEVDEQLRESRKVKDRRICICGHAMGRHLTEYGINQCRPSALHCACKHVRPVLEAGDTRYFLRKTEGSASFHALGRGLAIAISKGIEVKWLIELACDRCKATNQKLIPVATTQTGVAVDRDTGFNSLLCESCRLIV